MSSARSGLSRTPRRQGGALASQHCWRGGALSAEVSRILAARMLPTGSDLGRPNFPRFWKFSTPRFLCPFSLPNRAGPCPRWTLAVSGESADNAVFLRQLIDGHSALTGLSFTSMGHSLHGAIAFALGVVRHTRGSLFGMPVRKEVCRFDSPTNRARAVSLECPSGSRYGVHYAQAINAQAMYKPHSVSSPRLRGQGWRVGGFPPYTMAEV